MIDEMTIRVAIRTTARISFVLFLGAFLGKALYCLAPSSATRWLKAKKDALTLGFAGSHTVHLALILTLVAAIGREQALNRVMVVPFTAGFLFIYALAASVLFRRLTPLSSRLESLAHYYLMTLFAVSFTRHAFLKPLFYSPFVLVAVTSIATRIAAAVRSRDGRALSVSA